MELQREQTVSEDPNEQFIATAENEDKLDQLKKIGPKGAGKMSSPADNQDGGNQTPVTTSENATSAQTNQPMAELSDTNVIATVLGTKITAKDKAKLSGLIFGALLDQYAKDNKIEPTEGELDAFLLKTEEKEKQNQIKFEQDREKLLEELKSSSLSDRERKQKETHLATIEKILKSQREMKEQTKGMEEQLRPMKRKMAQQFVRAWKINKALYEKYGGRIIFQQAGPEPLDAYRDFLKEREKQVAFQIFDAECAVSFWKYFTNDAMHTFYSGEDGAKFIRTPWWLMEEPPR